MDRIYNVPLMFTFYNQKLKSFYILYGEKRFMSILEICRVWTKIKITEINQSSC